MQENKNETKEGLTLFLGILLPGGGYIITGDALKFIATFIPVLLITIIYIYLPYSIGDTYYSVNMMTYLYYSLRVLPLGTGIVAVWFYALYDSHKSIK